MIEIIANSFKDFQMEGTAFLATIKAMKPTKKALSSVALDALHNLILFIF